jgi:threonyl-tRNA synthetase
VVDKLPKEERLERLRHSASHVMAEAVLATFPDAKLAIGPPIDTGFYYDFDLPRPLTMDDLQVIEERMRESIARDHPFAQTLVSKEEARPLPSSPTLELIDELADEEVSTFRHGEFPMCAGPRRQHRSGAGVQAHQRGWRLLARGRAPPHAPAHLRRPAETEEELATTPQAEEAQRRDHRRLGRELDLFSFHEEYGPGLVYWHPKGGRVRTIAEDVWRQEHLKAGYELVYTPHVGKAALWETSGHLGFYRENMSVHGIEGRVLRRPMNCPFIQIRSSTRSYRELPAVGRAGRRLSVRRSGVLHGPMRVRGFTRTMPTSSAA